MMAGYRRGIFPWYNDGLPILWWSPDPRAVLTASTLHVSHSLRRTLNKQRFTVSWNHAFARVIAGCASNRQEGTWIVPAMQNAYIALHRQGFAHSVEVWRDAELVGGLYGVQCGALFAAESMFHTATDASKVALVRAVVDLSARGVELMDVQFLTPHLRRLGAQTMPRLEYLARVRTLRDRNVRLDFSDHEKKPTDFE
jgi:leucyl/phenylalanyl-tRNA--protein transferase